MKIKTNIYLVLLGLAWILSSCSKDPKISSDQLEQFVKYFGGSAVDHAESVIECNDGGYAVTGSVKDEHGKLKAFLIRTDKFGNELTWSPVLIGDTISNTGYAVVSLNDGFLIVGTATVLLNNSQNTDILVAKIGLEGNILWQKYFGGASDETANCAIQTQNGNYLIGGFTKSKGKGGKDAWALLLNPDGNVIWDQTQGGSSDDSYQTVIETDEDFLFIGSTESWINPGSNRSVFLVKINKSSSTGTPNDFAFYGGLMADSKIKAIRDGAGSIIIVRSVLNSSGYPNIYLLKVNQDIHQVEWEKNVSSASEIAGALFFRDNQICVVGNTVSGSVNHLLIKKINLDGGLDANFNLLGSASQIVNDGLNSSDGHIVLAGSNGVYNYFKIALLKLNY